MVYFVLDSNVVRTNTLWVICFSSTPKIGHCSYLTGVNRDIIALYVARCLIKPHWINENNVYMKP